MYKNVFYHKFIQERVENRPELKDVPDENEKKHALVEFYKLFTELYDGWTESKKAIDYNAFRKIFEITGQDEKKKRNKGATEKKKVVQRDGKNEEKSGENNEKPKNWIRGVLTRMKKGKQQ